MPDQLIRGRAWVDGKLRDDCVIHLAGARFGMVETWSRGHRGDRPDDLILPGFVDLHVHGGAGADFMDATADAARSVAAFHARHGTTTLAATTLSGTRDQIGRAIAAIDEARRQPDPAAAEIAAIHLEGPYLAPAKSGAHERANLRSADITEVEDWLSLTHGVRWLMTVAPEVDGVHELFEHFRGRILFSIGHTEASYAEVLDAIDRGASHVTHLLNAMTPFHQREPGVIGAAVISPQVTAEVIADGVHLHPVALRMCRQLLEKRLALVTDANRAAGLHDGEYTLGGRAIRVIDGVARTADGALAGSTLTMLRALQNIIELAGVRLERAIPMVTEIPARILGVDSHKGRIAEGFDADLVVLGPKLEVRRVVVKGRDVEG